MNDIYSIVSEFNIGSQFRFTNLGNAGGFSGSNIWKIESDIAGSFCLKKWPLTFQDEARIKWIHDILIFAKANGCPEITRPLKTQQGHTYLKAQSCFWELCPWASGVITNRSSLNEHQLHSAIETLARFHQATARYFFNFSRSKKIVDVRNQLLTLHDTVQLIDKQGCNSDLLATEIWRYYKTTAPSVAMDIARFLLPYSVQNYPIQPVIRDIRPEHLYFENNKVVSIIDFGAMDVDNIVCDLARMLGGFYDDDAHAFTNAIEIYSGFREIYPFEREVVLPLNHAGVILGIANWMHWITVEHRQFDSFELVQERIQRLFDRFRLY